MLHLRADRGAPKQENLPNVGKNSNFFFFLLALLFQAECETYIRYEGGNQVILRRNKVINIGLSILERIYSMLSKNSKTSCSPIDSSFILMLRKKQESIN